MTKTNTSTGVNYEEYMHNKLQSWGYSLIPRLPEQHRISFMPLQRKGSHHKPDILVKQGNNKVTIISCKRQARTETSKGGTAEEKVAHECLKLQYAIDDDKSQNRNLINTPAYIVLSGDAWTTKDWYLSEEFARDDRLNTPDVKIIWETDLHKFFPPLNGKEPVYDFESHPQDNQWGLFD